MTTPARTILFAASLPLGFLLGGAAAPDAPLRTGPAAASEAAEHSGLQRMLDTALDDERHAIAFYRAVMDKFGERRPFSNIINAERRHEAALLAQYDRLGLLPPSDRWAEHAFALPDSFADACDASVVAEVRNGALYDEMIGAIEDETDGTLDALGGFLEAVEGEDRLDRRGGVGSRRVLVRVVGGWYAVVRQPRRRLRLEEKLRAAGLLPAGAGLLLRLLERGVEAVHVHGQHN